MTGENGVPFTRRDGLLQRLGEGWGGEGGRVRRLVGWGGRKG